MIPVLIGLQILTVVAVVVLLMRRPVAAGAVDPRIAALPDAIAELRAKVDAQDAHVRGSFGEMRREMGEAAGLGRKEVSDKMDAIAQRLTAFTSEASAQQIALREALNAKFVELGGTQVTQAEKMRGVVADGLAKLNEDNSKKLEQMRETVDEKLHATLQTRLTESFGQVTDQLTKVHSGLGEMSKLSDGVQGLNRVFSNVKSRGGFAEVQLGRLLEQMLAPGQFVKNVTVKPNSREVVEYAVKFPSGAGDTLMPIDAKFPKEDWERLEAAYESGDAEEIKSLGRAFESAIRTEGKRICEKYIAPPVTTSHAIMFLPTEGLYAEVMRRDGLQAEIQSKCQVTIAGPSTLSAILTSFQMGFHMLAIQQKGDEVWKVLAATRGEFGKFGELLGKMETQVGTVQTTIQKLGVRTRAIDKTLRDVGTIEHQAEPGKLLGFEPGIAPLLAASEED